MVCEMFIVVTNYENDPFLCFCRSRSKVCGKNCFFFTQFPLTYGIQ